MIVMRQLRSLVSPVAALLLLCSPSIFPQSDASADKRTAEESIREAVVRYQMEGWYRGGDQSEKNAKTATERAIAKEMNFKFFFVSVNGKDPTDAFIHRLRDIPRIIKKVSASESSKQWRFAVVDKSTRQRGIVFRANEIRWLDKDSVEVEGGYFCDGLCGLIATYKLHRTKGEWVVTDSVVRRIS